MKKQVHSRRKTHPPIPPEVERFRAALSRLPYAELADRVRLLLIAAGYRDVKTNGRTALRGQNARGGWDLEASLTAGLAEQRVLVQAKRIAWAVPCRSVDELRGACLRAGAMQGIIFTTGAVAPAALRAARSVLFPSVRLIDGQELSRLLLAYGIPVAGETKPGLPAAAHDDLLPFGDDTGDAPTSPRRGEDGTVSRTGPAEFQTAHGSQPSAHAVTVTVELRGASDPAAVKEGR